MLEAVKLALRINTSVFDDEIGALIQAALKDMGIIGIQEPMQKTDVLFDPLIIRAVITFCKLNFGEVQKDTYDRLKASYDEQKAQLQMSSEYNGGGA